MIAQQIVVNGTFETQVPTAAGWVQDPLLPVMDASGAAYSGLWCAKMGGRAVVATDYLYQTLEVPEFAIATMTFYLSTSNTTADALSVVNTLTLKVRSQDGATDLRTLETWSNTDHDLGKGWIRQGPYDLSDFAGQIVQLYFTSNQTNALKATEFYLDEVRVDTLLNLPISSFPPLVSDQSRDLAGNIQQYGNQVYCSCLIRPEPNDPFFHPTYGPGLTGFGASGTFYSGGQELTTRAAWWTEAEGGGDQTSRGAKREFPSSGVVLVSEGSIAILDQLDSLSMWMVFKKHPNNVYSDTFGLGAGARFIPTNVEYGYGRVTVTFTPAYGSTFVSTVALNIDFVQDFVYIDVGSV